MSSNAMDVGCHCPMDYVLEEALNFDMLDTLIVGIGECAFYSKLITSEYGQQHWSYRLADNDLVFGCEKQIKQCVTEMLANTSNDLLILVTCIPNIANLDIEGYIRELNQDKRIYILATPHFKGFSPFDSILDLYSLLLSRQVRTSTRDAVAVWGENKSIVCKFKQEHIVGQTTIARLGELLECQRHIVFERRYLRGVKDYCDKYNLPLYNFVGLEVADVYSTYYKELGVKDVSAKARQLEEQIKLKPKKVAIKARHGVEIAKYLANFGIKTTLLIVDDFNVSNYEKISSYDNDIMIVKDYSVKFEQIKNCEYDAELDFTKVEEELFNKYGCELTSSLCEFALETL